MMKNYIKSLIIKASKPIFLGVLLLSGNWAKAQLSGTVTVGTGGTYTNFTALATAISTSGVNGALTVNVITNVTESATVTFAQNGSYPTTSTNTITINGGNYTFSNSATYEAIAMNGIDYLTIKNLVIQKTGTATSQIGVRFYGGADYNTMDGCTIEYTALSTGTTAGGAYIAFASSNTSLTSTSSTHNGSYNTINNCLMRTTNSNSPGPTYAICDQQGSSYYSSTATNNTFSNNNIQNFYNFAIRNYYTNGEQFLNNTITRANATSTNCNSTVYIFYSYWTYSTSRSTKFDGNTVKDLPSVNATISTGFTSTFYGVYAYYNYGNSTNKFSVSSNTFDNIKTSSTCYITYCWYNYDVNCSGNTIKNHLANSTFYGLYWYYPYNEIIVNNNTMTNNFTKGTTYFTYLFYGGRHEVVGNKIDNNTTADGSTGSTYGIYSYYPSMSATNRVDKNSFSNNTVGSYAYGIYSYYFNGTHNQNKIMNNTLYNANYSYYYGYIYAMQPIYYFNFQCNNNIIANNLGYYGSMGVYGYSYNSGSYSAECRQNTIQQDGAKCAYTYNYNYALYFYPYYHTKIDVSGNIVDVQNAYYAYPAYTYSTSLNNYVRWDYNTYYVKNMSGGQFWYCPAGSANDFSGWKGLSFTNAQNENFNDPIYVDKANSDFRSNCFETQNNVPQFNGIWPVTTPNTIDVTYATRNKYAADRGAIENFLDLQATKTDFTVGAQVCAGASVTSNIYVKNLFVDTVYNFNVSYIVSGKAKVSQKVTAKILPGDEAKIDFNIPILLNEAGNRTIKIFVDVPDDNNSNDSFTFSTFVKPAPGGGKFVASTKATTALYQYGKQNDVTVVNAPVYYDINAPRVYTNGDYNSTAGATTGWYAVAQAYTQGGRAVTGASITGATSTTDMELKFETADATLEDTMITLDVKIYDNVNGCDTTIKRKVLVYPSITPDFIFPSKICDGNAVLFENKSKVLSGSMEFSWNFGTGVAADTSAAPEPVFQFPTKGTYNVVLTAKTMPYGFKFSKTYAVTVNAIPTVGFTKVNACQGKAVTFNNTTTPTSGTVMNWNFGDNTTSVLTNPTKKYSKPGTYNVTLNADLNGCVATMTQKVYQFDKPAANFVLVSGTCDNETFNFTNKTVIVSGLVGSFWDFSDNSAVSTDENPSYKFTTAGTKSVTLVSTSEFGCADTVKKTITVKESPKTSFINTPLCSVKPTDFTNTTKAVASTNAVYTWDFGDGTTSGVESPTHDWNAKLGPKRVTYTISLDNGCSQSVSKNLVVLTQPKPNFTASDACSGDDVVFVNNTTWPQGDISYKWDFGDGTTSTNSDPSKKYVTTVTLTPKVTLYAYIAGGCKDSITQEITINEAPRTCDFVATPDYATGFYAIKVEPMNANGVVGGQAAVNYVWVFEGGGTKPTSGVNAAVSNDFPSDGTYKVTMRAKMQQTTCECSITKNVVMNRASAKELMNTGVSVYPNPANNQFQVALTENFGKTINIQLLSMSGQVVKNMTSENTGIITVDASALSSGVYMVQISNGSEVVTRKMNIQK